MAHQMTNQGYLDGLASFYLSTHVLENRGEVRGHRAVVQIKEMELKGKLTLDDGQLLVSNFHNTGQLSLTNMKIGGQQFNSDGLMQLDNVMLDLQEKLVLGEEAKESFHHVYINAGFVEDNSLMEQSGEVGIYTWKYEHTGTVSTVSTHDERNIFYVKTEEIKLTGKGQLEDAVYEVTHFNEAVKFLKGVDGYESYQFSKELGVEVGDDLNLNGAVQRNCGLRAKGDHVKVDIHYNTAHDLIFISQHELELAGFYNAKGVYANSGGNLTNTTVINAADGSIHLQAQGLLANSGTLLGREVIGTAAAITNMGNAQGQLQTLFTATAGNILNEGGKIAGGYVQLQASGDVINICKVVGVHWNGFNIIYHYEKGIISGGMGTEETKGLGLYVQAAHVINDGSDLVSIGSNYIYGQQGVIFTPRLQVDVHQWTSRKWYGKKTTHTEITPLITDSRVYSLQGKNYIQSEQGGVLSVATQFSALQGTQITALEDVKLYSLKTENFSAHSEKKFWGITKSKHTEFHELAFANLFLDNGCTGIVSQQGNIDARGAWFDYEGDLEMEAAGLILFGCDKLNNTITHQRRSPQLTFPGLQAYNIWRHGGNAYNLDDSLRYIHRFRHSANGLELLTNSFNLGIDAYNNLNSLTRALNNHTVIDELLARYKLGGAYGFSPIFTLTLPEIKMTSQFQNLSATGVNKSGHIFLKAGQGVCLLEGVKVTAKDVIDVDTPKLFLQGSSLLNNYSQRVDAVSLNMMPLYQLQGIGYSRSTLQLSEDNYRYAELATEKNMHLHWDNKPIDVVFEDGGVIKARSINAEINHLIIKDEQSNLSSSSQSFGFSTSGDLSFYAGHTTRKKTLHHSGIEVTEGIDENHSLHIHDAYLEGGRIISTQGINQTVIDQLVTIPLQDQEAGFGVGLGVNTYDLNRMLEGKSCNEVGEKAIASGEVVVDRVNYLALQQPVIYGQQATLPEISALYGYLHTTSADGCAKIKNSETHVSLNLPLTNQSYLASVSENITAAQKKMSNVSTFFNPHAVKDPSLQEEKISSSIQDKDKKLSQEKQRSTSVELSVNENRQPTSKKAKEKSDEKLFQEIKKKAFVKAHLSKIAELTKKYKENPSVENKNNLTQAIEQSVITVMKEVTNNGVEASSKILGSSHHITTKFYVSGSGVFINFIFNFISANKNTDIKREDVLQEGVTHTAADVAFGLGLRCAVGAAGAYVSWGFVGFCISDQLLYDQKISQELLKQGREHFNESQQLRDKGQYFAAWGMENLANHQVAVAAQVNAAHQLAQVPEHVADGVKWLWQKVASTCNKHHFFHSSKQKARQRCEAGRECKI